MRRWLMNRFPYEVKETLYRLRTRFPHASFTISNPQAFEGSFAIETIEACKMVGVYVFIVDMDKFIKEDNPYWVEENSEIHWAIPVSDYQGE